MSHVTCRMWHFACHMSHCAFHIVHVTCHISNAYVDSWYMLNNFCFDVFAQKWVFVIMSHVACHMSHVTCHMSHVLCQMLMLILGTCWTIFVFMSMLKCRCLWVKMAMIFFDLTFDLTTLSCDNTNHRAGSQLIIVFCDILLTDILFLNFVMVMFVSENILSASTLACNHKSQVNSRKES